jgi:hypothetical protein
MLPRNHALKERGGARSWTWWLKWLFASYGVAVGAFILLILVLMPFVGLSRSTNILFDNSRVVMISLTALGGILCYRYLK